MNDPELRFAIAACTAAYCGEARVCNGGKIRWDRLLQLADRHRIQALCWHGLRDGGLEIPSSIAAQFAERSAAIAEMNLRTTAECARLQSILQRDDIPYLFLKGLSLGSLAYPQPFLKMSWDIDLLIDGNGVRHAAQALRGAGYEPVVPRSADSDRLVRWHEASKESVWFSKTGNFTIDLHSRLADNPRMLAGMGIASPRQTVAIAAGISLPTLSKDELFAYLCVHGASSAWFRLKWICDLAALIHQEPASEITRLYERSQALGAGRAADQALLLAVELFGVEISDGLQKNLRSRRVSRWLTYIARSQLTNETEPTERPLGTASIHYSQLLLRPSWRFKLSEFVRQVRDVVGQNA